VSRPRLAALLLALLGLLACGLGAVLDLSAFERAYFTAVMALWQLPLGCLALLIAWHLTGGRWGRVVGDALEAGLRTLPLLALLTLPLLLDLAAFYPWTQPDYLAAHPDVARKAAWLSPAMFALRSLIYLALWLALAFGLSTAATPFAVRPRRRAPAALAAILYALTASFAALDWLLSLDPTFTSSVFGMLTMAGEAAAGLSLALLATCALAPRRGTAGAGLGSLLLAVVLLWVYFAFIQLLVAWSGDLPPDAAWYLARSEGLWRVAVWLLVLGHAVLPVALLLSARARTSWRALAAVSGLVLAMRLLDVCWLVLPAFGERMPPAWLVAGAFAAVGGLWLCALLWLGERRLGRLPCTAEARHG
jgi:hypothetical protein